MKEISARQKKLAKGIASGKSIAQAGREAGYSHGQSAHQALTRAPIQAYLHDLMDKHGLTDDFLLNELKDGFTSTKIHGSDDDYIEIPDRGVRHKYLETSLRLKRYLDTNKEDDSVIERNTLVLIGKLVVSEKEKPDFSLQGKMIQGNGNG